MAIIEWILVGILGFVFLISLIFSLSDLWKDRKFYVEKSKNVRKFKKVKRGK